MGAINVYGQSIRKWPEKDSLFQGTTGSSISESIKPAKVITKQHGAAGFETAKDRKEAEASWTDRKNAHYARLALMPGSKSWPTDVWLVFFSHQPASTPKAGFSVPIPKLPELVYETKKEIEEAGILGVICGHVGNGEFRVCLRSSSKHY